MFYSIGEDSYKKPQLQKGASCVLDGLSITLQPNIEAFEEDLRQLLCEDRASRENREQESLSINIVERKLQVNE